MNAVQIASGSEIDTRLAVAGQGYRAQAVFSGLNRRVHILEYEGANLVGMVEELAERALDLKLGKIFVKAPVEDRAALETARMEAEATIPGYFSGEPAVVMSRFLDQNRRQRPAAEEEESILRKIRSRPADPSVAALPDGYLMRVAKARKRVLSNEDPMALPNFTRADFSRMLTVQPDRGCGVTS